MRLQNKLDSLPPVQNDLLLRLYHGLYIITGAVVSHLQHGVGVRIVVGDVTHVPLVFESDVERARVVRLARHSA